MDCLSPTLSHQRSTGGLHLAVKRRGEASVLDRLRQEGCLKARFPRAEPGGGLEVVTLNSSGGVAGGDRLGTAIGAGAGTRATIASQAAERFYRALPGSVSAVTNAVSVEPGAALEWLPQESIVFDGAALRRSLRIDLAADASFLGVESLVFGRTAMGEVVHRADIDDLIEVRRDGRLLLHDRIRLSGAVADMLGRAAIGRGAAAVATILHLAPGAESRLDALRAALAPHDAGASASSQAEAGASAWDGMLIARIVGENGACLRDAVVAGLAVLRGSRSLPRVWSC